MSHKRFNTRNIVPLERCFYDLLQKKKRNKMPGNGKEKKKKSYHSQIRLKVDVKEH